MPLRLSVTVISADFRILPLRIRDGVSGSEEVVVRGNSEDIQIEFKRNASDTSFAGEKHGF